MRKRLTIFLVLPLMLMSFHARHIIPEQDYRSAITTQYLTTGTIIADTDQALCWDKLRITGIVLSLSTNNANHINDIAFVFIGLPLLNTNRRKSHIEYCGKKMVRALMLQFHPRLRLHRLFPAFIASLFFATKKRLHFTKSLFQNVLIAYYAFPVHDTPCHSHAVRWFLPFPQNTPAPSKPVPCFCHQ